MSRTKSTLVTASLVLAALATLGAMVGTATADSEPTTPVKRKRVPMLHLSWCNKLLRKTFPDDKSFRIEACDKHGVVGVVKDVRFAVLATGEVFEVGDDGSLTLFASGPN